MPDVVAQMLSASCQNSQVIPQWEKSKLLAGSKEALPIAYGEKVYEELVYLVIPLNTIWTKTFIWQQLKQCKGNTTSDVGWKQAFSLFYYKSPSILKNNLHQHAAPMWMVLCLGEIKKNEGPQVED